MADLSLGASNLISSTINGVAGLVGARLNYGYSKELAAQQNQYNIDMWNMQNAYNSPSAQMQRLKEAGLNPNLMYGQGNVGNATSAPQQVVPERPQYGDVLSKIGEQIGKLNFAMLQQDLRGKKADASLKEAQAEDAWSDISAKKLMDEYLLPVQYYDFKSNQYKDFLDDRSIHVFNRGNSGIRSRMATYLSRLDAYRRYMPLMYESVQNSQFGRKLGMLDYNYNSMRNKWQPWQYGVKLGSDVVGTFFSPFKFKAR